MAELRCPTCGLYWGAETAEGHDLTEPYVEEAPEAYQCPLATPESREHHTVWALERMAEAQEVAVDMLERIAIAQETLAENTAGPGPSVVNPLTQGA